MYFLSQSSAKKHFLNFSESCCRPLDYFLVLLLDLQIHDNAECQNYLVLTVIIVYTRYSIGSIFHGNFHSLQLIPLLKKKMVIVK